MIMNHCTRFSIFHRQRINRDGKAVREFTKAGHLWDILQAKNPFFCLSESDVFSANRGSGLVQDLKETRASPPATRGDLSTMMISCHEWMDAPRVVAPDVHFILHHVTQATA